MSFKDIFVKEYTLIDLYHYIETENDIQNLIIMEISLTETDRNYRWTPNVDNWLENFRSEVLRWIRGRINRLRGLNYTNTII